MGLNKMKAFDDPIYSLLMLGDLIPPQVATKSLRAAKVVHAANELQNIKYKNTNRNQLMSEINNLEMERQVTTRLLDNERKKIDVAMATPDEAPKANDEWLQVFTRSVDSSRMPTYTVRDLEELLTFRSLNSDQRLQFTPTTNSRAAIAIADITDGTSRRANCMLANRFCVPGAQNHCRTISGDEGNIRGDAPGCTCNPFTQHCLNLYAGGGLGVGSTETVINNRYANKSKKYANLYLHLRRVEKDIQHKLRLLNTRAIV
jgi:hypothetical protein